MDEDDINIKIQTSPEITDRSRSFLYSRWLWILVFLLIFATIIGFFWYFYGNSQSNVSQTIRGTQEEKIRLAYNNPDVHFNILLAHAKIVSTSTPVAMSLVDISRVPEEFSDFILNGASGFRVLENSLESQMSAVDIFYSLHQTTIAKTHARLDKLVNSQVSLLSNKRTDYTAILEFEKSGYKVQILEKDNMRGGVEIEIKLIK